ncbi:unnamed protein product [Cochlearia groenlandica]
MSALSRIEQTLTHWNKISSLLHKPIKPLLPINHLNDLLKLCANTNNLRLGESIHSHLIVTNQSSRPQDLFQTNSLINLYGKCRETVIARKVFDTMPERNVVSFSAMMKGYQDTLFDSEVLKLFKNMGSCSSGQSLLPNEYIATLVFKSCSSLKRLEEGKQCHGCFIKHGLLSHDYVRNTLVYMYSSCSDKGEEAIRVLDELESIDLSAFSSALSGYLDNGLLKEALYVLRKLANEDFVLNNVTFMSCLRLCSCLKELGLAKQIHNQMVRVGFDCYDEAKGGLINMYGKCGNALYARRVFDNAHCDRDRNIVLCTSIMDAYFQDKSFEEALNLFAKTEAPNEYTFAISLNSIAELSLLKHGDLVHGLALKSGFKSHVMVGNALVNMYAKSGSIEDSRKTFSEMGLKDVVTWNTMICGFSHHGLGKEALESFENMTVEAAEAGECPNRITFIGVLQACSHAGFVNKGLYFFNKVMKEHRVEPDLRHYTCVVGLLSRAGLFDEAEKFMRTSSSHIEWDVVAWRTLLNACYVRRNYELGKKVAEFAIERHPNDPGMYVLLSNIHAKSREWESVAKVRSLMKTRHVKKEPGVSWISIRNRTHVFLAEENQHPEITLIYTKVKEILSKIKHLGYSPDVSGGVCHDIEEEQREDNLCYHSEKLAVAYGLLKTPENSPLYVTKNLRICDDCHVAVKLISKLTNRLIVVRDANRFHHFRDGECSCCDYW